MGVAGWYLRRRMAPRAAHVMLAMGVGFIAIVVPLQIFVGDLHGLNTLEYQPAKVAAMEAHWKTGEMPLLLFAWPDVVADANHYEIGIPSLGSFILTHSWDGVVKGLKAFPEEARPPVAPIFFSFRAMVGLGTLMLITAILGLWLAWRRRLLTSRAYHRLLVCMAPSGFIAVLAGWVTTEVGRQPFTVYGLLRTAESVTPSLTTPSVAATLTLFVLVDCTIFGSGLYFILRLIRQGPELQADEHRRVHGTASRPLAYPDISEGDHHAG